MGNALAICKGNPPTTDQTNNQNKPETVVATRQRKRFNPFFQPNTQTEGQINFQQRYKFVSNYQDRFMGRCTVLQEIETGSLVLNKEIEFKTDAQCRQLVQKYKEKKQNQEHQETILRILQIYGKRVDGLIKDVSKATIVMEYPLISIKREFNHRLLNKTDFQIEQIKNFIFSTIRGYATLQRNGCLNDKVRMAHIFMGLQMKQSVIKVIDSQLLQKPSNFLCMSKGGQKLPQNHDIYLSPEEFKAIIQMNAEPPFEERNKAAVFSLGASILDICIMNTSFNVYHYDQKYMSNGKVKGLINIARKRHGPLIYKLLNEMLEWDPKKRPTFEELEIMIARPLSSSDMTRSSMRLSTIKDENTKYMTTTRHSGKYGRISEVSMMNHSMADREFCRGGEQIQQEQIQEIIHMHQIYIGGSQYIGQKKRDLKHGKGKYIFKDRSYYEGWWKDDMMHGEGQLFFPNGRLQYQGEWAFDQPNGWGVLYSGGQTNRANLWTRYEGQMKNGEMHGRGKLYFIDGTIFEGEFQNGKVFGRGCRTYPNGEMVQKQWRLMNLQTFLNENGHNSRLPVRLSADARNF